MVLFAQHDDNHMVGKGRTLPNAAVGAIATTVLYFVPVIQAIAPIAGGSVAGYLQEQGPGGGMKAGGVKGLIMTLPAIFIGIIAAGVLAGVPIIGEILTGSIIIIVAIIVAHSVALGLVGGLFGGMIADE